MTTTTRTKKLTFKKSDEDFSQLPKKTSAIKGDRFEMSAKPYGDLPAVTKGNGYINPWVVEGVGVCTMRRKPLHRNRFTVIGRALVFNSVLKGNKANTIGGMFGKLDGGRLTWSSPLTPATRRAILASLKEVPVQEQRWATEAETEKYIEDEIKWRKDCLIAAVQAMERTDAYLDAQERHIIKRLDALRARRKKLGEKYVAGLKQRQKLLTV